MSDIIKFKEIVIYKGEMKMSNINKERMQEIEQKTLKLLEKIDLEENPYVDIVALVRKEGFIVEPNTMEIETTGYLFVNEDEKERNIYVNTQFRNPEKETDVVFKKSRFITAHEYGHFILHKKEGEPIYAHRDTEHRKEPIELEADYFARSILMPLEYFKSYYEILNELGGNEEKFTIEILSRLFKVTKNKVRKRVEDLLILSQ